MIPPLILGAVLAGGRSSRFGSDKAAASWNGRSLAEHAAALIGQHVDRVVMVGPDGVADMPGPGLGPLGGIAGVLDLAASEGFTSVLTIGCDMPRAPDDLIAALLRRAPSYCPEAPVLGHWPAALGSQLQGWLSGEDRSVRNWARAIGALPIASPVELANVNTPEGLDGAMTSSRVEPAAILRPDGVVPGKRTLAIEAPVAVEIDGIGYAVMMMTPADLRAFAVGFMLTERLADTVADIVNVDSFEGEAGVILRVALADRCRGRMQDRVRHRTGDTSCGLCGIASLEQLRRPVAGRPPRPAASREVLFSALAGLRAHQPLNAATGAVHAAAACDASGRFVAAFEDVGRHNALDKLIGALAWDGKRPDFLLVTSRLSFEMVDKALVAGVPMLVGISRPRRWARSIMPARTGLTLVALARPDAMLVMCDPHGHLGGTSESSP